MPELGTVLREYFDEAAIPVDFEQTISGRVPLPAPARPRLSPAVAFALGVLVAAIALLPLMLLRSASKPAVVATTVPAVTSAPTVTTVSVTTAAPVAKLTPVANPRLVGWFPFDGSAANLADPSGATNGEIIESATGSAADQLFFTADRFGNPESAFDANGGESGIAARNSGYARIEVPMTEELRLDSGTVSAWIMPVGEIANQTWWFDIVSFGSDGYTLGIDGYHRPTVNRVFDRDQRLRSASETDCWWTADGLLAVDRWYHVAMVFDGRQFALYVDGVPVDLVSDLTGSTQSIGECDPAASPQGTTLYVGNNPLANPVSAHVDDVLIYDGVLSPEAIAELAGDRP
jgi:hypothetical protein